MIDILKAILVLAVFSGIPIMCYSWSLRHPYSSCYDDMEASGYAAFGCCGGLAGGTKNTEYLSEMCIECPYFVMTVDGKNMRKEGGSNEATQETNP